MCKHTAFLFGATILLVGLSASGDTGWDANIAARSVPPLVAPMRSGPYPPGEALPEQSVEDGVRIAGQVIRREDYAALRASGLIPMRRALTDAELVEALRPAARQRIRSVSDLAAHARSTFRDYEPFLYWGFRSKGSGGVVGKAEETYREHFTEQGVFKPRYLALSGPPTVAMLRWAGSYWNTGDERWAQAVRDAFVPFYEVNRPPLNGIRDSKARGMWHVLGCAARVPFLIEAYALTHSSPAWTDEDHARFYKAMLERARFLRYTTVPVGPWPEYNPFGYGNWILYQLQGLLAIAAYFDDFRESDDWFQHASEGIGAHGDWCVLPDSGLDEYSYSYASQVAGQMEYCYNTLAQNQLPFPPRFQANVRRLHELFLKIAHPAGQRMPFGDTHRGGDAGVSRCRWAALAFLDARFRWFAGDVTDEYIDAGARALHGPRADAAARAFRELEPVAPVRTSHLLDEVGWAVMRSGWERDATVIAVPYRASSRVFHSGWEMLSFNLWSGAYPISTKLLGFRSYTQGYPAGFCRTPRQANHVIVRGAELRRVAGSLRNWFSAPTLDYLHADHRGWQDGEITARRRLLFLKPDWVLIIDDIEGSTAADLLWQAHTDELLPRVDEHEAAVGVNEVSVRVVSVDAPFSLEELAVEGEDRTVRLLTREQSGMLPLRFVTVVHIGTQDVRCRSGQAEDCAWLEFSAGDAPLRRLALDRSDQVGARFLALQEAGALTFLASDGNPASGLTPLSALVTPPTAWNGRVFSAQEERPFVAASVESIPADGIDLFAYHGRPEMTPLGTAARVAWRAPRRARHSVLYRLVGAGRWQRQFQPGWRERAWILLPDLQPGAEYEVKVVSETADGAVAESVTLRKAAPSEWRPY